MTTSTQNSPALYNVNADPADAATGHAVLGLVLAAAARRPHLRGSIVSFQFDQERGIGILVQDAGHRQHLANSLGFDGEIQDFRVSSPAPGVGYQREGMIEGILVRIWNFEA